MRNARLPFALALLISVTIWVSREARANPLDSFGFGSRAIAMGSAAAADSTDFSAVYYNPAGLAGSEGLSFSIGYSHASHNLAMNGRDNDVDSARGIVGGFVAPGSLFGMPFAFGIATHLPDERISRIRTMAQEQPRWELYDNPQLLYLSTALSLRPLPFMEIGIGISYLAATRGRVDISGSLDISQPYDSKLRHEVDADLRSVRYPQAGLRFLLGKGFKLGVAYREGARLKLKLDTHLSGQVDAFGLEIPARYSLSSSNVGVFIPRQAIIGSSFDGLDRRLVVNVDMVWQNWSAYESSVSRSIAELDVKAPEGLPVTIPDNPKPTEIIPPRFHDRLVPRIGAEYQGFRSEAVEVPFRIGYIYERSPAPPQRERTNFVDADRHILSVGTGLRLIRPILELPGDLRLDIHGQYSILPERLMHKKNPADFIGDYRAGGNIVALGATLSAGFP